MFFISYIKICFLFLMSAFFTSMLELSHAYVYIGGYSSCCLPWQLKQKFLTKEQVELFKDQLAELLQETSRGNLPISLLSTAKQIEGDGVLENPESDTTLTPQPSTDAPTSTAAALSDLRTLYGAKHLERALQSLQTMKGSEVAVLAGGKTMPGSPNVSLGSLGTEPSSDAEYYTPLGSPDESRRSSVAATSTFVSWVWLDLVWNWVTLKLAVVL